MTLATDTVTTVTPSASVLECHTDRATLVQALTTVGVAVPRRPAVPTLGGVLLDGRDGCLTVTATDCETAVSVRVPEAVATPGRLLVEHAEATKLLGALVTGIRKRDADTMPVTLRATDDGTAVLDLGGYTMPLTTYPVEDFPTLPETPPTVAELDRARFTTDTRRVLPATSTEDTVPAFTGVHLQASPGTLTLAATDRFRLAVAELPATTAATVDRSVLFPARQLATVLKHCSGDRVCLGLDAVGGWVSLSCGALTMLTRPLEASFPPYERLFPETTITARADRRDTLTQAIARATTTLEAKKHTARDRGHGPASGAQIAVTMDPTGSVTVVPVLGEHAEKVTASEYPAEVDGLSEPMRVLFSAPYLRDAVSTLDGDTVTFQLATATRPVVFTVDAPGYRHLLMPVHPAKS